MLQLLYYNRAGTTSFGSEHPNYFIPQTAVMEINHLWVNTYYEAEVGLRYSSNCQMLTGHAINPVTC